MRKLWAFKTFTNAALTLYIIHIYPFPFSGINSWEKALKSPKIQAYFGCSSVASPNHDINDFDGIPRKFELFSLYFYPEFNGRKKGWNWYFIHKKMLLIPLCFPKQTVRRHQFFFLFCSIQVHKSFLGRIFQISLWGAVKCTGLFWFFCPNVNIVNWGGASKILIDLWEIWDSKRLWISCDSNLIKCWWYGSR